jgi:parvulin-like peptidyl-prolyl isomerase
MKQIENCLRGLTLAVALVLSPVVHGGTDEVLANVGALAVTASELEMALASSPFATQFVAMDEDDQAALRGDLLRRLVVQRLLLLEAERTGISGASAFKGEMNNFRMGLLYRHYMDRLRERIEVPQEVEAKFRNDHGDDRDAISAARSSYLSERYRAVRQMTLQVLGERYHVKMHEGLIGPGSTSDTVLFEGDDIEIRYGELVDPVEYPTAPNPEWVKEQLYKRSELLVVAKAAESENVDVSEGVISYRSERLPALLMEQKGNEWITDEKVLKEYFDHNPEIGQIQERWHIGQLVTASRDEATELRKRIFGGESLFTLASQYSIDPYGKDQKGDMGWVRQGRGMPQIEQALATLADGGVSEVIETPLGFHLVTILERRPGGRKSYSAVRDRIRQGFVAERMGPYLQELEARFKVEWKVIDNAAGTKG